MWSIVLDWGRYIASNYNTSYKQKCIIMSKFVKYIFIFFIYFFFIMQEHRQLTANLVVRMIREINEQLFHQTELIHFSREERNHESTTFQLLIERESKIYKIELEIIIYWTLLIYTFVLFIIFTLLRIYLCII